MSSVGGNFTRRTDHVPGPRKSRLSCFAGLPVEPWWWIRTWRLASRTITSTSRSSPNRLWDSAFLQAPIRASHQTVRSLLRFSDAWLTGAKQNTITVNTMAVTTIRRSIVNLENYGVGTTVRQTEQKKKKNCKW